MFQNRWVFNLSRLNFIVVCTTVTQPENILYTNWNEEWLSKKKKKKK